jgi:hypothetical protein
MNLKDFKRYAEESASDYGLSAYVVTVLAGIYGCHDKNDLSYSIAAWDKKRSKHINARQKNPASCLSEFRNNLKLHFTDYSQNVENIEI